MTQDGDKKIYRAWLCKHCGERVDPTMAFCWSCGRDRQGGVIVDIPEQVDAIRLSHCSACGYDLRGTALDSTCPECGDPLTPDLREVRAYWAPAAQPPGRVSLFFRDPKQMLPCAMISGLFASCVYALQADVETHNSSFGTQLFSVVSLIFGVITLVLFVLGFTAAFLFGFSTPAADVGSYDMPGSQSVGRIMRGRMMRKVLFVIVVLLILSLLNGRS